MCYRYNYSINSKWGYWLNSNDICNFIAFNYTFKYSFITMFLQQLHEEYVVKLWIFANQGMVFQSGSNLYFLNKSKVKRS